MAHLGYMIGETSERKIVRFMDGSMIEISVEPAMISTQEDLKRLIAMSTLELMGIDLHTHRMQIVDTGDVNQFECDYFVMISEPNVQEMWKWTADTSTLVIRCAKTLQDLVDVVDYAENYFEERIDKLELNFYMIDKAQPIVDMVRRLLQRLYDLVQQCDHFSLTVSNTPYLDMIWDVFGPITTKLHMSTHTTEILSVLNRFPNLVYLKYSRPHDVNLWRAFFNKSLLAPLQSVVFDNVVSHEFLQHLDVIIDRTMWEVDVTRPVAHHNTQIVVRKM